METEDRPRFVLALGGAVVGGGVSLADEGANHACLYTPIRVLAPRGHLGWAVALVGNNWEWPGK